MKKAKYFDRLRVECNFGSKYFDDAAKAQASFLEQYFADNGIRLKVVQILNEGGMEN